MAYLDYDPNDDCSHTRWNYDDRGNHWCQDCGIWHSFPHEPDEPELTACEPPEKGKDCVE